MSDMKDKIATITGASRGIGSSIAKQLGALGIKVVVNYSNSEEKAFDAHFSINVKGTYFACQEAMKYMENNGRIINFSTSVLGQVFPGYSLYASTKGAVEQITRQLAKDDKCLIYLTDTSEYINKDKMEYFLKQVKDKNPTKVRYTQYSGELLDKMRDVEFDGEKIILKEYDTKSPEGEKYFYIEIAGEKIDIIDGYYKLLDYRGDYLKLFPQ